MNNQRNEQNKTTGTQDSSGMDDQSKNLKENSKGLDENHGRMDIQNTSLLLSSPNTDKPGSTQTFLEEGHQPNLSF